MKRSRMFFGYVSMFTGVLLLAFAAHSIRETEHVSSGDQARAAAAALGGGVLTFVVSRRLLVALD